MHSTPTLSLTASAVIEVQAAADANSPAPPPRFLMVAYTGGPMRVAGWRYPERPDYQLQQVLDPKFNYPTAAEDRIWRVQLKSIRWKPTGEIKQLRATVQAFESTICRSECEEVISFG